MPTYRAKRSHVRKEGLFGRRVVTAYENEVTTDEHYDEKAFPYYFIPSGEIYLSAPIISFKDSKLTIECSGADSIYYTLDGSDPDSTKTKYTAPVTLSESKTVKAAGYKGTMRGVIASSEVTVAEGGVD